MHKNKPFVVHRLTGEFKMKNKSFKLAALVMAAALVFGGCTKDDTQKEPPSPENLIPQQGGSITLACFVPDTLNPLATQYQNVRDVLMIVYEGLFKAESTLEATPVVADSYTVSTSNKIYTIKIKPNIKFHDGTILDAADVVATFDYIKHYETPYSELFKNVLSYKITDALTVSVELISPQADFVNALDFPILPAGLAKQSFAKENSSFVPIGTGKFKYNGRLQNKNMTFVRNDEWHGSKKAYLDSIKVSFMHSSDDLIHAFDAGEIDMFTTNGSNWGKFNFTANHKIYETSSPRYAFIGINTNKEPTSDVVLRQDINSVINRDEIVEDVMFSHASPATLPIISTAYYFDNAAKSESGSSHSTQKPQILKYNISLKLLYNSESDIKQRTAAYLKKAFEPYGITLVPEAVTFEEYKRRISEANYDLYIGEVIMNNNMNMDFMFSSLQKTDQNVCTFVSDEFDSLLANLNMMSPDKQNSELFFENFRKYFDENVPQIPLFHTNTALFVSSYIKGGITANMSTFYGDIGNFFISYK